MGFFKNIKNKIQEMFTRSRTKQLPEGKEQHWFLQKGYLPNPITIDQLYNGERQIVMNLNQFGQSYLASDGTMKKLMVANCWDSKDTMILGMDQYIAFELPADIMPNDPEVLRCVVQGYLNCRNLFKQKDCIFVGNPYEMNGAEYMQSMQNYVDTNIGFQIGEFKREQARISRLEKERNDQIKQKQQQAESNRIEWGAQNRYQQNNETRLNRIKNPTINYRGSYIAENGKEHVNYNAVNLNSGDILKVRDLEKVCKDGTGRYVYVGYLENTFNEFDVELTSGKPNGIPVCFSTDKKVEDIVQNQNPYEVQRLLQLLSQERNFRENNGYMNYIGALDRNFNITNGWDNSKDINSRIREIQDQARAEQMGQTQNAQYWTH